ncbi:DUF2079 domain-containing protein [Alkalinema sp. FACHB-956]|uniref:DUF2079 domain-containing protein n=1 Tax=Alkalinema sp. FACHB-956 TaxID=2692768 RepID=UPI0018EFE9E4|nr:DUF2079 domain-containing protein [Alkalinema sp. FACHB-956]
MRAVKWLPLESPAALPVDLPPKPLQWLMGISMLILMGCSTVRHLLLRSGSLDLGYFDQAAYLLSQGEVPIVSFWGYHFMGGHADWIMYFVAILYKLYPTVYWLLGLQAIALSLSPWPVWALARQAGLTTAQASTIAGTTLLYPLLFNLNLSDFHPEVLAFPAILTALWAARANRIGWFGSAIFLALGCRDALALTIAAMGLWLIVWEKRRVCGAIALFSGTLWFLLATKVVIPAFRPHGVESVVRYGYLGQSLNEIVFNIFFKPWLWLEHIVSLETLNYLFVLLIPLAWGLVGLRSWKPLVPLVAAIPQLAMNLLSENDLMRNIIHQYSLPILPFLLLTVIAILAEGKGSIPSRRWIWVWAIVSFLAMAKYGQFTGKYLDGFETWQARREAIAQIPAHQGTVLTTHELIPHLTHRPGIYQITPNQPPQSFAAMDYVLINQHYPAFRKNPALATRWLNQLKADRQLQLQFEKEGVFLFVQRSHAKTLTSQAKR